MKQSPPQAGISLIECLVSVAISALMLAGLANVISLALSGYQETQSVIKSRTWPEEVIQRIARAIDTAEQKKKTGLSVKADHTSHDWFYGKNQNGIVRQVSFEWSATAGILNEMDEAKIPRAILTNVTNFSVTAPDTSDAALILVSLTVNNQGAATTYNLRRRLGGTW